MDQQAIRKSNILLLHRQYQDGGIGRDTETVDRQFMESIGLSADRTGSAGIAGLDADDDLARQIEQRLSLPPGWMDEMHVPYPGDQDSEHQVQRVQEMLEPATDAVREVVRQSEADASANQGDGPANVVASG